MDEKQLSVSGTAIYVDGEKSNFSNLQHFQDNLEVQGCLENVANFANGWHFLFCSELVRFCRLYCLKAGVV